MNDKAISPAKRYSTIKYVFGIADTFTLVILLLVFQFFGFSSLLAGALNRLAGNYYLALAGYLCVVYAVYYIMDLPSNFYRSFMLEHQFHLSDQKAGDWLRDQFKSFAISLIIFIILAEAFYLAMNIFPGDWWVVSSLFWVFFSVVLARLTPVLLIPLFFKYKPLSDTALKSRILGLAEKMKVKLLDVFEIDFSKKTLKANAAFVGVGRTKRVILADTLKDKYSYDEIEVILAHEFSHYRLKHLLLLISINAVVIVASFYLIFVSGPYAVKAFSLGALSDIASFPLIALYMAAMGIICAPLTNYISRCFERDADRMALEVTGLKEAFISTMRKLGEQNLADSDPAPVIKIFFFDHPPIGERIEMAKRFPENLK